MSSSVTSPQRFSGTYDHFYDGSFDRDISAKMKVPKRIRVSGQNDSEPTVNWAGYNGTQQKISMEVPERIVVAGGEQLVSSRNVLREVELENQIMPSVDPEQFRVQTPPRNITLDSYSYPGIDYSSPVEQDRESTSTPASSNAGLLSRSENLSNAHFQDPGTPGLTADLSPTEEVQLLRRQVGKLNRRVMSLEMDLQQRANREMFLYTLGVAYFLIKALLWLNRN